MKVKVEFDVMQAAAVREALFRSTSKDSYEFPSTRTVEIRKAIVELDEKIEEALKNETTDA